MTASSVHVSTERKLRHVRVPTPQGLLHGLVAAEHSAEPGWGGMFGGGGEGMGSVGGPGALGGGGAVWACGV